MLYIMCHMEQRTRTKPRRQIVLSPDADAWVEAMAEARGLAVSVFLDQLIRAEWNNGGEDEAKKAARRKKNTPTP